MGSLAFEIFYVRMTPFFFVPCTFLPLITIVMYGHDALAVIPVNVHVSPAISTVMYDQLYSPCVTVKMHASPAIY